MEERSIRFQAAFDQSFALIPTGREAAAAQKLEPVESARAVRLLAEALTSSHGPDFRLLDALDIREHPLNLSPGDLECLIAVRLDGIPRLCVVQERRKPTRMRAGAQTLETTPAVLPRRVRETSFIGVELRSQEGWPVSRVAVAVTLPDGSIRTLASDANGLVLVESVPRGICHIVLPSVDANRWRPRNGEHSVVRRDPGPTHVVRPGECLSKVAHRFDVDDWRVVWDDRANAELRRKRKSPHILNPGDVVALPAIEVAQMTAPTDAMHSIVVTQPKARLVTVRLRLQSRWKSALAGLSYRICFVADGESVVRVGVAPSDAEGVIAERVPVTTERAVIQFERPRLSFTLRISALEPIEEEERGAVVAHGVEARLRALGFVAERGDVASAIARFQREELGHSSPSGVLDSATRVRLEELYGA